MLLYVQVLELIIWCMVPCIASYRSSTISEDRNLCKDGGQFLAHVSEAMLLLTLCNDVYQFPCIKCESKGTQFVCSLSCIVG